MEPPPSFGILGNVQVVGPQGLAELAGGRHRALVAALALRPGAVVPVWRLVEALWGEQPPRTAVRSLHSHVARLRLVLERCGLPGAVATREPGYLLTAEPDAVDAARFERLLRAIRAGLAGGRLDGAVESLGEALDLWRGGALADADPTGWTELEAQRLDGLRRAALADRCEVLLRLGGYGEALGEAEQLLAADPLGDRLTGLRMIALWGCGRPAEALEAFQRLRQALADELGVDPSRELAELHTGMLRGASAAELRPPGAVIGSATVIVTPRPAQLPPPVGYFTGREGELRSLDDVRAGVVLICGQGGIGKTSLAVQWGHSVAGRYPDGQIFVDAQGHDRAAALGPGEVVAALLRCLGVAEERVPHELGERAGLYRSLLAGKRMLIVLDNAGSTNQVIPALPGTPTSLLLVTSRNSLAALMTHAEVGQVVLDGLAAAEATDLLVKVLGPQRTASEPEALHRLAGLCGRLPLALRIASAKLVMQPQASIAGFCDALEEGDRLGHLGVEEGSRSVRAVFDSAYRSLTDPAQRLLRRLGIHPGPHLAAALAGALSGGAPADAPTDAAGAGAPGESGPAELVAAHLLAEVPAGRYRLHDLVRLFADRCLSGQERAEAAERLLDWYLSAAQAANRILEPSHDRLRAVLRHAAPPQPFPAIRESALSFLDAERENLLPVVRFAAEIGQHAAACQLTYLLTGYYADRGNGPERVTMCRHAVRAARLLGDAAVEAEMHRALGIAYRSVYQLQPALDSHLRALPLLRRLGDDAGLAHLHNNIGGTYAELHRYDEAIESYRLALQLHTATGNAAGAATVHRNLGYVYLRIDSYELSFGHLGQALETSRVIGHRKLEASTLDSLGEAHLRRGDHGQALACLRAALEICRDTGNQRYEMHALTSIGLVHLASGAPGEAAQPLSRALAISREIGHRPAEERILEAQAKVTRALAEWAGSLT